MAVQPFLSREKFLHFEGEFYRQVAEIAGKYKILTAFHCHGPVREIMDDVWSMGYSFFEPFEPPPRGNVSISEALAAGTKEEVRETVFCFSWISGPGDNPYYCKITQALIIFDIFMFNLNC